MWITLKILENYKRFHVKHQISQNKFKKIKLHFKNVENIKVINNVSRETLNKKFINKYYK